MTNEIKHAESKIEFYKEALASCPNDDYEGINRNYQHIKDWENHRADLVQEHEQKLITQ